MREILELEVWAQNLKTALRSNQIEDFFASEHSLMNVSSREIKNRLYAKSIVNIYRHGLNLIFEFTNRNFFVLNLSEGAYLNISEKPYSSEGMIFITFNNMSVLNVIDPTTTSKIEYVRYNLNSSKILNNSGYDISYLNINQFRDIVMGTEMKIKELLINQSLIAGLGNALVDEVLYVSKIKPTKLASELTEDQIDMVYENIFSLMKKGLKIVKQEIKGKLDCSKLDFLTLHYRYPKPCNLCGTNIAKAKISGKVTYYCRKCQK